MEAFINAVIDSKNRYDSDCNGALNTSTTSSRPSRKAPKPPSVDGAILSSKTRKSTPPRNLRPGLEQVHSRKDSPHQWAQYNPITDPLTGQAAVTSSLGHTGSGPGGTGLTPAGPCSPHSVSVSSSKPDPVPRPSLNDLSSVQNDISELTDFSNNNNTNNNTNTNTNNHGNHNNNIQYSPPPSDPSLLREALSHVVSQHSQDASKSNILQQAINSIPESLTVREALQQLVAKSEGIAEEQILLAEEIERQKSQISESEPIHSEPPRSSCAASIGPDDENEYQATQPQRQPQSTSHVPRYIAKVMPTPQHSDPEADGRHSQIMNFSTAYAAQVPIETTAVQPSVDPSKTQPTNVGWNQPTTNQTGYAVYDATATTVETHSDRNTTSDGNKTDTVNTSKKDSQVSPKRWVSPNRRLREFIPDSAGTLPSNLLDSLIPNDDTDLPGTPPPVRWPESGQHLAKTRQATKERLAKYRDIYWTRIKQNQRHMRENSPASSPGKRTPTKRTIRHAEECDSISPILKPPTPATTSTLRNQSSSTVNSSTSGVNDKNQASTPSCGLGSPIQEEALDDISVKYITDELSRRRQVLTSTVKNLTQIVDSQRGRAQRSPTTESPFAKPIHNQLVWFEEVRKKRRSESQKRGEGSPPTQEHLMKDLSQRLQEIHSITPPKQVVLGTPMR